MFPCLSFCVENVVFKSIILAQQNHLAQLSIVMLFYIYTTVHVSTTTIATTDTTAATTKTRVLFSTIATHRGEGNPLDLHQ